MAIFVAVLWLVGLLAFGWLVAYIVYRGKPVEGALNRKKREGFWRGVFYGKDW